jgi:hypothetical protein
MKALGDGWHKAALTGLGGDVRESRAASAKDRSFPGATGRCDQVTGNTLKVRRTYDSKPELSGIIQIAPPLRKWRVASPRPSHLHAADSFIQQSEQRHRIRRIFSVSNDLGPTIKCLEGHRTTTEEPSEKFNTIEPGGIIHIDGPAPGGHCCPCG